MGADCRIGDERGQAAWSVPLFSDDLPCVLEFLVDKRQRASGWREHLVLPVVKKPESKDKGRDREVFVGELQ